MTKLVPFNPPSISAQKPEKKKLTDKGTKELLTLIKESKDIETHAMKLIEKRVMDE